MKKRFSISPTICLTFLLVFVINTTASSQVALTYDHDQFQLLKSSNNLIYSFNKYESFDKYELILYNDKGSKLNRLTFESRAPLEILEVDDIGDLTVFHMSGSDYTILALDQDGNEKASTTLSFADKVRDIDMVTSKNGITMIVEVKRKKVGIGLLVQHYSLDLESSWSYEKFPEKGKYFIYDACSNEEGSIAIVYKNGNSDDYGLCLLSNKGDEVAFTDIDEQQLSKFTPYLLRYSGNSIMMVSDFGSTSTETFKGIPLGLSVMTFNGSNGENTSANHISFEEVQQAVGDKRTDGSPLYKDGPALRVLDIQDINGVKTLITEAYVFKERSYTKPSSSSSSVSSTTYYKQLELMDFYLLKVDNLQSDIHRIWKPARIIEVEGSSFTSAEGLCDIFEYNRFFSYQGMIGNQILYQGFAQMHQYYNTVSVTAPYESFATRHYWGTPLNCTPNSRPFLQSYNKPFGSTFLAKDLTNTGVLATKSGYILFRYNTTTDQISFNPINIK